jgi:tRNA A-37 threonylcarbamoyl transferase component Bud32
MADMAESQIAFESTLAAAPPASGDRLAPGAIAGDYVVDRFLGAGAMGEVYAGRHPLIGKRVAIKVLKRELAADPEAAERFLREAQAVNQIDHPNVIDVFNFGRLQGGDGRLYLVMDLVDGQSLRKAIEDGPLAVDAALDVLAKVAEALDAAHARGVVHRDLKPDNVMLGGSQSVFVLDFGIAKLVARGGEQGTLTAKGTWLGTPSYMAPEQWSADGAGPASDRYALGVMAYELLAGALPFQAPTLPQMMEQHFRAPVPALSARGTVTHHETLDPVLARAMAKSPEARFATAGELVAALRTAAGGTRAIAPAKRSLVVPAVAGVGVLALAIVGYLVVRGGPATDDDRAPSANPIPPAPPPPADFARVQITTSPKDATVWREGHRVGLTPTTAELRPGAAVALTIAKPGYRTIVERIAGDRLVAGKELAITKVLEPIIAFQGVWQNRSDGQLRGFKRAGDRVEVSKHATITGAGEPWRSFELVEPPADHPDLVVFATTAELTDARGGGDPSCTIAHRIEYRFDPVAETLDVSAEEVDTVFQQGRCTVRSRTPGERIALSRVDRDATGEIRRTRPPVGRPEIRSSNTPRPRPNRVTPPVNQAANVDRAPQVTPQQQANPPPLPPQPQTPQRQVRGDSQQANPPTQVPSPQGN